jgi:hypothetical protein
MTPLELETMIERAAIKEHMGKIPRLEAERQSREEIEQERESAK